MPKRVLKLGQGGLPVARGRRAELNGERHAQPITRSATDASRGIRLDPDRAAPILLAVSPCRSGSTAYLRVFGYSGVESYFQPLKNVLRWQLQGEEFAWSVPNGSATVFLKETLGPFTEDESRFNPLQALLDAGYPQDRLRLLIIGRDPLQTWVSWHAYWRERTSIENFITAYHTADLVGRHARDRGIDTSHLVYEALRDQPAEIVVRRLMGHLGIPYRSRAIGGWEELPPYGAPGSNVILPREPPPFVTPNIHDRATRATGLEYVGREIGGSATQRERAMIADRGVFEIYRGWCRESDALLREY